MCFFCLCFFFFKQKTAYEMRISDWSSDVCSSDLLHDLAGLAEAALRHVHVAPGDLDRVVAVRRQTLDGGDRGIGGLRHGGQAAPHRAAVEVPGAGAAEAGAAAVLGAAEAEPVAEVPQTGLLRTAVALAAAALAAIRTTARGEK